MSPPGAGGPEEPLLAVHEIQGNVLGGFNKDHQALIPLSFDDGEASVARVRAWLRELLPRITTLDEVVAYKREFRARRASNELRSDSDLPALWMNVSLSFPGLLKLTPEADLFTDEPFRDGLAKAAGRLGDPKVPGTPGEPGTWVVGAPGDRPDVFVIVAGDLADQVNTEVARLRASAEAAGLRWGRHEVGHDLAFFNGGNVQYESGREHFGFEDGISQPGVRGRVGPGEFLTQRTIDSPGEEHEVEFSSPGQPLVWAGEFVLGYGTQNTSFPRVEGEACRLQPATGERDPEAIAPAWARNGSFLVYRRLRQDVPAFNQFLERTAQHLCTQAGFASMTAEKLGAHLVGRWKSGAPVMRTPHADDPVLGNTKGSNNAFGYETASNPNDGFPPVPSDVQGDVCPIAAHVRKVNPRDQPTDQGSPTNTLHHMILRRGIPFGRPLPHGALTDPTNEERGLLFLSYQASIAEQFELLSQRWMNQPDRPTNPAGAAGMGLDLVVGQAPGGSRVRTCVLRAGGSQASISTQDANPAEWVVATGGEYFFTPSISALREVLARA